jgi:hypothetical protein
LQKRCSCCTISSMEGPRSFLGLVMGTGATATVSAALWWPGGAKAAGTGGGGSVCRPGAGAGRGPSSATVRSTPTLAGMGGARPALGGSLRSAGGRMSLVWAFMVWAGRAGMAGFFLAVPPGPTRGGAEAPTSRGEGEAGMSPPSARGCVAF